MVGVESSSAMAVSTTLAEGTECSSGGNHTVSPSEVQPAPKKKRNLPGMPDPDAEVIALSPTTLLATNRFVCEICNKGFQRDQNLQLHRRGHNLPWKLKQRNGKEIRKRVYVCPEKTCVHNDPARALGDLTGIKKHFSRKHGEKKWNCERCSKKYAVQSDWKAHMKICGTKEYRCDCGTLFSRRDSFITHRAFCDALAQESTRSQTQTQTQTLAYSNSDHHHQTNPQAEAVVLPPSCSPPPPPHTPSTAVLSPVLSIQSSEVPENTTAKIRMGTETGRGTCLATTTAAATTMSGSSTSGGNTNVTNTTGVFASVFAPSAISQPSRSSPSSYSNLICAAARGDRNRNTTVEQPMSLSLSSSLYLSTPTLFPAPDQDFHHHKHHHHPYIPAPQPALSATALLQKAAQMGAKSSNTSFLHALGLAMPSSSATTTNHHQGTTNGQWSSIQMKQEREDRIRPTTTTTGVTDLMMGRPATTTLDFLGLGMGGGNYDSSSGFSAYLSSIGSGIHVTAAGPSFRGVNSGESNGWDDSDERKPALL